MKLDGNLIMAQNVRCAYPNLTKPSRPQAYPNSPLMYSLDLIMPNTDPVAAETMEIYQQLAAEKWKEHAPNIMQAISADKKARSYATGEEKVDKNFQRKTDIFPDGTFIVTAKGKEEEPPTMIDSQGKPMDFIRNANEWMDIAKSIYSGCYVNAIFRPWLRLANPGVSFTLVAVQFAKDGEKFASVSAPSVDGMFQAVAGPAPVMGGFTPPPPAAPTTPAGVPDFMKQ